MKKFIVLIVSFVGLSSCYINNDDAKFSKVIIHCNEKSICETFKIYFEDSLYTPIYKWSDSVLFEIPCNSEFGYATIFGTKSPRRIFLSPHDKLSITVDENGLFNFNGGLKEINDFLLYKLDGLLSLSYEKDENDFIDEWVECGSNLINYIENSTLPIFFKEMEKRRLRYLMSTLLMSYPLHNSRINPNNAKSSSGSLIESVVSNYLIEDESLIRLSEYKQAFESWIQFVSRKINSNNDLDIINFQLKYIKEHISGHQLSEYLNHICIVNHIKAGNIDHIDELKLYHDSLVINNKLDSEFSEIFNKYGKLSKGRLAPNFELYNIDGIRYSLNSFIGRYILLDVWATWCGPCLKEKPFMKRIEQQFKDKNICIVYVSIDKDEHEWKKSIQEDGESDFQLYLGGKKQFMEDYQISLIPRFILIDDNGRIINSNMSKPSDPQTIEYLKSLKLSSI